MRTHAQKYVSGFENVIFYVLVNCFIKDDCMIILYDYLNINSFYQWKGQETYEIFTFTKLTFGASYNLSSDFFLSKFSFYF
jgi:hypothetical protein